MFSAQQAESLVTTRVSQADGKKREQWVTCTLLRPAHFDGQSVQGRLVTDMLSATTLPFLRARPERLLPLHCLASSAAVDAVHMDGFAPFSFLNFKTK